LRIQLVLVLAVAMLLQCEDAPRSEGSLWFAQYNSNVSVIGHVPEEISQVYINFYYTELSACHGFVSSWVHGTAKSFPIHLLLPLWCKWSHCH